MADRFDAVFNLIRQKAGPSNWSAGVEFTRANKVIKESEDDDTVTFRVISPLGRAWQVDIYPEDEDFQCDCPSRAPCCEHVAAAVIALRAADREGTEVPTHRPEVAQLHYHLRRDGDQLSMERLRVGVGAEVPFRGSLKSPPEFGQPQIMTLDGDLELEQTLGHWRHGRIPRPEMLKFLTALTRCSGRIFFEGRPISVVTRPVTPVLVVEDANRGFYVQLKPHPQALRFRNGAALLENQLRPLDEHAGIAEGERRRLEQGRGYTPDQVSELLHLLALLERTLPIIRQTKRLPNVQAEAPWILIETQTQRDQLMVLPTLVYGDPPIARIDRGSLTVFDTSQAIPLRDEREEQRLVQRLYHQLNLEVGRRATFEAEHAVVFSSKLERWNQADTNDTFRIQGDAHKAFHLHASPLKGELFMGEDGPEVSFSSESGARADASSVLAAWSRGQSLAPLEGGGYASVPTQWLAEYGTTLWALLQAKEDREDTPLSAAGEVLKLAQAMGVSAPPQYERLRPLFENFDGLPEPALPQDLTATLRPYQRQGVSWLNFHRDTGLGALLADDMGLGKTLQALSSVKGRTLVVAPTSVLHNWQREASRFRPNLRVSLYHSPQRQLDLEADLTLTTWAILRLDIDQLTKVHWDSVILDEAQTIKNPDSQVAKAAHRLKGRYRLALSGTPVENRLTDLWSQMHFVEPGLLGTRETFEERYAHPIAQGDEMRAQELRSRLRPFLLRRKKSEVAKDLPPRTELVERCELSPQERSVYDALRAAAQKEVLEKLAEGGNVLQALELLLRLRQAASHTGLIPGQKEAAKQPSAKTKLLLELLEPLAAGGHKTLVFSQWTSMLDLVEPALKEANLPFLRLDGSTSDRQAVVDAFQNPEGPPVLLLSLKAGGTGLTLTAADHVVLMDPWWNPAVEDQAADRAHRIGQDKPVFVHRLVATDTVEEKILALQEDKRRLADAALSHGAGSSGLSREELLSLLS